MIEVVCPYCNRDTKYDETEERLTDGDRVQCKCSNCGKNFAADVEVEVSLHGQKSPCLNGEGECTPGRIVTTWCAICERRIPT